MLQRTRSTRLPAAAWRSRSKVTPAIGVGPCGVRTATSSALALEARDEHGIELGQGARDGDRHPALLVVLEPFDGAPEPGLEVVRAGEVATVVAAHDLELTVDRLHGVGGGEGAAHLRGVAEEGQVMLA